MYFATLQDAIYMNGHGAFVWAAYAMTFLVLAALVLAPLGKIRRFKRDEQRRVRRDSIPEQDA